MDIRITERGWPGHLCVGSRCEFHRNTLIEVDGSDPVVISTVGRWRPDGSKQYEEIGINRFYETMAFHADITDPYKDALVEREVWFSSPWSVDTPEGDQLANDQHDAVVRELSEYLCRGKAI